MVMSGGVDTLDGEWTMANDRLSVHVGINYRFSVCRRQRELPVRILLGPAATRKYMREKGWIVIPRGQHYHGKGEMRAPLVFNVRGVGPWAIAVETRPRPAPPSRNRARSAPAQPQA